MLSSFTSEKTSSGYSSLPLKSPRISLSFSSSGGTSSSDMLPSSVTPASPRRATFSNLVPSRKALLRLISIFLILFILLVALLRTTLSETDVSSLDLSPADAEHPDGGRLGEKGFWLKDLGESAELAFNLGPLADSSSAYFAGITEFVDSAFPPWLANILQRSLTTYFPTEASALLGHDSYAGAKVLEMVDYKLIHQTDKDVSDQSRRSVEAWVQMNAVSERGDGGDWEVDFYTDDKALGWLKSLRTAETAREWSIDAAKVEESKHGESLMEWAWLAMRRGVLKADYFRYLVLLVRGGVYSDIDTEPLSPIISWGTHRPRLYDISATDGPAWWLNIKQNPAVVVGVDVDVHAYNGWEKGWPRPLGICQWTLTSSPHHPIYIDAVRRVINATQYIDQFVKEVPGKIAVLEKEKPSGWKQQVEKLQKQEETHKDILPVMDHTGPGVWSDAVLAYLQARYNVTWHDLRGIARPLRIGEVLVLPITGFSPGGQPDFHSGRREDEQAAVVHNFRGSWKWEGF